MQVEEPTGPAGGAKHSTPEEQGEDFQATLMEMLASPEMRESLNRAGGEKAAVVAVVAKHCAAQDLKRRRGAGAVEEEAAVGVQAS